MNEELKRNLDNKHIAMCEPSSVRNPKALLRFRLIVSGNCNLTKFIDENAITGSVDCFHLRSHHFSLLEVDVGGDHPIGCMPSVQDDDFCHSVVKELLEHSLELADSLRTIIRSVSFFEMGYLPDLFGLMAIYSPLRKRGKQII